ncbi:MAG: protein kinase [Methylococcales bacterium]|nr:protein kinase [Methylococcales bacterium]
MKKTKEILDIPQQNDCDNNDKPKYDTSRLALLMEKGGIQNIGSKSNQDFLTDNSTDQNATLSFSLLEELQLWDEIEQNYTIEAGQTIRDNYCLDSKIGEGGLWEVWKAVDLIQDAGDGKDKFVAIKFINHRIRNDPDALKALVREFAQYKNLIHPNIVKAYELNRDGNEVFIAMEYLDGNPLKEFIEQHPDGIPLEQAEPIIKGMCDALEYAHNKGIVHFNFKPGNVFYNESTQVCKVIDFGISRLSCSEERDNTRFYPGTLGAMTTAYACGEMLMEGEPDLKYDIYGLACIVYELLSGHHPFNKTKALQAERENIQPNRISGLTKNEFQAILHGLSFRREKRTTNASHFYSELFVPKKHKKKKHKNKKIKVKKIKRYVKWPIIGAAAIIIPFTLYKGYNSWKTNQVRTNIQQLSDSTLSGFSSLSLVKQKELLNTPSLRLALVKYAAINNNPDNNILRLSAQFNPKIQQLLMTDNEVRRFLTTHYSHIVDLAITEDDFELAEKISKNTLEQYPDSMHLMTQFKGITLKKEKRIAALQLRYEQCAKDNTKKLTDLFPCLQQTQTLLGKVDNSNDFSSSIDLTTRYNKEISSAISDNQPSVAETLLANWYVLEREENIQRKQLEQKLAHFSQDKKQILSSTKDNTDQQINQLFVIAKQQRLKKQLMTPLDDNAWQTYQKILTMSPNSEKAFAGIKEITKTYVLWAGLEIKKGNFQLAVLLFNKALIVSPDDQKALSGLAQLDKNNFDQLEQPAPQKIIEPTINQSQYDNIEISNLLNIAEQQIKNKQLMAPAEDNAWNTYKKILSINPGNVLAELGINKISAIYLLRAKEKMEIGEYRQAEHLFDRVLLISPKNMDAMLGLIRLKKNIKDQ